MSEREINPWIVGGPGGGDPDEAAMRDYIERVIRDRMGKDIDASGARISQEAARDLIERVVRDQLGPLFGPGRVEIESLGSEGGIWRFRLQAPEWMLADPRVSALFRATGQLSRPGGTPITPPDEWATAWDIRAPIELVGTGVVSILSRELAVERAALGRELTLEEADRAVCRALVDLTADGVINQAVVSTPITPAAFDVGVYFTRPLSGGSRTFYTLSVRKGERG